MAGGRPRKQTSTNVPVTKPASAEKKKFKINNDMKILVRSNLFGELKYINHKTGDEVIWENCGETQFLYPEDIRAMKAKQLIFLKENWISIVGIESDDYDTDVVDVIDIYKALDIYQYYEKSVCPDDINIIFNWSAKEIKNKVPQMARTIRQTIAVRANELIRDGILDSLSKIKALEEVLRCELTSPDED